MKAWLWLCSALALCAFVSAQDYIQDGATAASSSFPLLSQMGMHQAPPRDVSESRAAALEEQKSANVVTLPPMIVFPNYYTFLLYQHYLMMWNLYAWNMANRAHVQGPVMIPYL
eukprot:c22163_g1_i1.p1 GENE.c22163_g1_i1~~c22163_g1_i1.p1  ORF type:complete len:114 (+),score=15.93 c22163_g1_i1:30-371(+)